MRSILSACPQYCTEEPKTTQIDSIQTFLLHGLQSNNELKEILPFETFLQTDSSHFATAMEKGNAWKRLYGTDRRFRLAVFKFIYQVHKTRTVYSSTWCKKSSTKQTEFKRLNKDTAKLGPRHRLARSTENVQKQRTLSSVTLLKMVALYFSEMLVPFSQATRRHVPDDHNLDVPCEIRSSRDNEH